MSVPPEALSAEPITLPRSLQAKVLTNLFQQATARLRSGQIPPGPAGAIEEYQLLHACGERLIAADRAGLISDTLPDLRAVIDWHTQPDPPEAQGGIQRVREPYNLFLDIAGGQLLFANLEPEGLRITCDDQGRPKPCGGLMPRVNPSHLELSRNEQHAATCDFLAAAIQSAAENVAETPLPTIWDHGERSYSIDRVNPILVTREEDDILQTFLDQDRAYDSTGLTTETGCKNISRAITDLQAHYNAVFAAAIRAPGARGAGGYFIRVRSLP
jgi:hypothetical protein